MLRTWGRAQNILLCRGPIVISRPAEPAQNEPYLRRLLQSMSRTATTSSRLLVQPGQLDSVGTHLLHSVVPAPISEARSVSTRTASPGCAASEAIAPAR